MRLEEIGLILTIMIFAVNGMIMVSEATAVESGLTYMKSGNTTPTVPDINLFAESIDINATAESNPLLQIWNFVGDLVSMGKQFWGFLTDALFSYHRLIDLFFVPLGNSFIPIATSLKIIFIIIQVFSIISILVMFVSAIRGNG